MTNIKGLTSTIFDVIAESSFVISTMFSRKSFYEKSVILEFGCKPWQINNTLKRLEKGKYIKSKKEKFYLTPKGLLHANYYKLKNIKLNPSEKWDGKWRLIIFDIPETTRAIRDVLRGKLREWNCYKIQQSVFVYPFSCEKEIIAINKILEIEPCVKIFSVNDLGEIEKTVKQHYNL